MNYEVIKEIENEIIQINNSNCEDTINVVNYLNKVIIQSPQTPRK